MKTLDWAVWCVGVFCIGWMIGDVKLSLDAIQELSERE
jgi:hypothetical protein